MKRSTFFYSLWCIVVIAAFIIAAFAGYSPFADGGRPLFRHGASGPHHK